MKGKPELNLTSAAFKDGERIPERYTCEGENASPPLAWSEAGDEVKSWVLILEDPGAPRGIFTHWVIYNIPAVSTSLPEALPTTGKLPNGALQGRNETLKLGYSGPCPPPGSVHHYNFVLYAVDNVLTLSEGSTRQQILDAINGHVLSMGKLTGLCSR